ncbi:MAG: hypothetical protein ACK410_01280 [Acinetobacter sp.]
MNQKRVKIEQLLALSNDLNFENSSISGTLKLVSDADVSLVHEFIDRTFNDDFNYEKIIPKKNEVSPFRLNLIHDSHNYATYQSYIQNKLDISKKVNFNEDDVIYENLHLLNKGHEEYMPVLELFVKFIRSLSDNYFQKDNILIFFSKNYCEVPVQPRNFGKYLELVEFYIKNDHLIKSLHEFVNWMTEQKSDSNSTESLSTHKSELYVIVATEIIEHLASVDKSERIFNLIKNIENVINDTKSKYSLYLDDFKYSKFIDKINKHSEDLLNKVNKVITDLQSQILAIPLAISAITLFKDVTKINAYIYAGFLVYLLMVFYSSCQQAYNLDHIKNQIKQFSEIAKLPNKLLSEWKGEIRPVNKKILSHQFFLVLVSFFIGILIGVCIINIPLLYNFISGLDQIEFNIWIIVLLCFAKIASIVFEENDGK